MKMVFSGMLGLPHRPPKLHRERWGQQVGYIYRTGKERVGADGVPSDEIGRTLNDIRNARLTLELKDELVCGR